MFFFFFFFFYVGRIAIQLETASREDLVKFVRQQNKKIKKLQTVQKEGVEKEEKVKAENQALLEKLKNAEEEVSFFSFHFIPSLPFPSLSSSPFFLSFHSLPFPSHSFLTPPPPFSLPPPTRPKKQSTKKNASKEKLKLKIHNSNNYKKKKHPFQSN